MSAVCASWLIRVLVIRYTSVRVPQMFVGSVLVLVIGVYGGFGVGDPQLSLVVPVKSPGLVGFVDVAVTVDT